MKNDKFIDFIYNVAMYLVLFSFFLTIFLVNPVSAATVESSVSVTGNSQVEVHTDVVSTTTSSSNNSTYRKTEVTVNGEKTVVESDTPGTDAVEVSSTNGEVTKKVDTKEEVKKSVLQDEPTPRPTQYQKKVETHSMVSYIFYALQDFIERLFK